MKLRPKVLRTEDYPDQKSWISKLTGPINDFFLDMFQILNKNITFKENIAGDVITVIIDGNYPLDVRWENKNLPIAAWIGKCYEVSGKHTTYTNGLFLDWEMRSNSQLRINKVVGVSPSTTNPFYLTIVAITG